MLNQNQLKFARFSFWLLAILLNSQVRCIFKEPKEAISYAVSKLLILPLIIVIYQLLQASQMMNQQSFAENNTHESILCFFSFCRLQNQQIATKELNLHREHTQYLEELNLNSPAFSSLAQLARLGSKQHFLKEKKVLKDYLYKTELQISRYLREWKKKQLNQVNRLIDYFDRAKLIKMLKDFKNLTHQQQLEHLQIINALYDLTKKQKNGLSQYYSFLTDKFVECLKASFKKSQSTLAIVRQVFTNRQYDYFSFCKESISFNAQSKAVQLKAMIQAELSKQKFFAQLLSSDNEGKACEAENASFYQVETEKQRSRVINPFRDQDYSCQRSIQSSSLQKSFISERFTQRRPKRSQSYISKSRQIEKKELCTRINYGKKHYPIMIEDKQTDRLVNSFMQKSIRRRRNQSSQQRIEIPFGVQMKGDSVMIIWNGRKKIQIMDFIFQQPKVKYLIIHDKNMATAQQISKILKINQSIQGIDLNCENSIKLKDFTPSRLRFLNCFQSFRFMREKDNVKYFPWKKQTIRQKVDEVCNFERYSLQSYTLSAIPQKLTQLNFCRLQENFSLNMHLNSSLIHSKITCLQILTFSNVVFQYPSYVLLSELFKSNQNLRTLAFNTCQIKFQVALKSFEHINKENLHELLLEVSDYEPKQVLSQKSCKKITSFLHLQVLILVNFIFFDRQAQGQEVSTFPEISLLTKLNHLNLYNCEPIYSNFLQNLHSNTYQIMKTLNLGCTNISSQAVEALSRFVSLQALVLDYIPLSSQDLTNITKEMPTLRKLSIEGLNEGLKNQKEINKFAIGNSCEFVKCEQFENFCHKSLEYVNISECDGFKYYQWSSFTQLKIIKTSFQQLSAQVKNRLNLLKIHLFQEERSSALQQANCKFADGKKQSSKKNKERSKLQDIQQFFNNSNEKSSVLDSVAKPIQLVSLIKTQRLNHAKINVHPPNSTDSYIPMRSALKSRSRRVVKNSSKVKGEKFCIVCQRVQSSEKRKRKDEQRQQ